jgi:hypothetical protein
MAGVCQPVTLGTVTGQPVAIAVDPMFVYVTNAELDAGGSLESFPIAGGTAAVLASGLDGPGDVVLSPSSIYLATSASGQAVLVIPKAGGDAGVFQAGNDATLRRLAIDTTNLSWTNAALEDVVLSPLSGAAFTALGVTGAMLQGIASDGTSLYWLDGADGGALLSVPETAANLTTANVKTLAQGYASPLDIAVDAANVYFTSAGSVLRVAKAGGPVTTIASGQGLARGVAVDGTYVYWANGTGGTLARQLIGGGPHATILASGLASPARIALDAKAIYWTNLGDGTVMRLAK